MVNKFLLHVLDCGYGLQRKTKFGMQRKSDVCVGGASLKVAMYNCRLESQKNSN